MKCTFQIINSEDGCRSKPMVCTREELAKLLGESCPAERIDLNLVLVVLECHEKDGETQLEWSTAPLMTVRNFMAYFGGSGNG